MDAGFLQLPRPVDVVRLVEPRPQLDDRRDLLAIAHGVHQRADDARVAAGAVKRLLDGQHVRVRRGLLEEIDHAARNSRKGDAAGCRARGWPQTNRFARATPRPPARRTADRAAPANDRLRTAPSAASDSAGRRSRRDRPRPAAACRSSACADSRRAIVLDLQPHGVALAAVVQFVLHRLEQVGRFLLVNVKLAVARHAERPVAEDASCPGKSPPGNGRSSCAQKDVILPPVGARQPDQPRQHARHLHHRQCA